MLDFPGFFQASVAGSNSMSQLPVSSTGAGALAVALDAALRAGDIVKENFYDQKDVRFKALHDPVTNVDLAAEKAAMDFLLKEYPEFGIISEESEPVNPDAEFRWIIDPIDGTRNYVMGIPHVGVSIGLADRSSIAAGVVYDPIRGEIFTAERGFGAHLNGEPSPYPTRQDWKAACWGSTWAPPTRTASLPWKSYQESGRRCRACGSWDAARWDWPTPPADAWTSIFIAASPNGTWPLASFWCRRQAESSGTGTATRLL